MVGAVFDPETKNVKEWIIDDPYGNTLDDWKGSGDNIHLSNSYFCKTLKIVVAL